MTNYCLVHLWQVTPEQAQRLLKRYLWHSPGVEVSYNAASGLWHIVKPLHTRWHYGRFTYIHTGDGVISSVAL